MSVTENPPTAGFSCSFPKISVNQITLSPKKRQPPSPETARTAGGSDRPGAIKAPGLYPAFSFVPRFCAKRAGSLVPQRLPQPSHTGLKPAGRGRDSAPPAIGAHSGPQAVTRGFLALAGVSPLAGVPLPAPVCLSAVDRTHPPLAGWAGSCRDYCRSTSCRCCRCSWCAPP